MARNCRKCGEIIPNRIKIDGISRSIGNRKFCLNCSPWKGHNTKPDDPSRPNAPRKWADKSEERKEKGRTRSYLKGIFRKKQLIDLAGGQCKLCGYKKCIGALTFHHRDPATKLFGLSTNNLNKPWEMVLAEAEKCELLCIRCHMEVEEEIRANSDKLGYKNIAKKMGYEIQYLDKQWKLFQNGSWTGMKEEKRL